MDPLRPFATLIRSLWTGKTSTSNAPQRGRGTASETGSSNRLADSSATASAGAVASRLQARLAGLGDWNPIRARELFVEHILLSELGDDLSRDPGFAELVQRVSGQLGSEARVSARLDQLLRTLSKRET